MRLSRQFQACLFFHEKVLSAQKRRSNQNQLTKQKQASKKQQRQQVFAKTFKRGEIVYFAFGAFDAQNLFIKN